MADDLRLLDVEVHRKVFVRECDYWHDVGGDSPPSDWYDRRNHHESVPHYTTDMRAAGLVLERVLRLSTNYDWLLETNWSEALRRQVWEVSVYDSGADDGLWTAEVEEDSLPLAICRAALKALEGKS